MENKKEFKFIKGALKQGAPADIYFYTDVDYWSVNDFVWEFDYLVKYIDPSKIRVHINSAGGSVIDGMSVFAKIIDCPIPTECINDALAASMGSIIWAAGDELYMKDYALLMIHNPFCDCDGRKEKNQMTDAFTQQLKTIYVKRFGLTEEEAEDIMDGKEGDDGTFLTAAQAVEKGFIKEDHVIETPKAVKDKIDAALKNSKGGAQIKAVYGLLSATLLTATINEQNQIPNSITMKENEISVFAALFGLTGEKATSENVMAKINEIKAQAAQAESLKAQLDEVQAKYNKVNAEYTGAQTSINNLTEDLKQTKAALKVYQDAEAIAQENKVNALIDQAIAECKINKDERDAYIKMAQNDFALAENVLAKIPARDNLGNIISSANTESAAGGMISEEEKVKEKVKAILGDFKPRKLK